MTDKTPDRIEQRSATTNAGLGILAASPFLHALAQAGKEKLTNRPPKPEPPKIIVPPQLEPRLRRRERREAGSVA